MRDRAKEQASFPAMLWVCRNDGFCFVGAPLRWNAYPSRPNSTKYDGSTVCDKLVLGSSHGTGRNSFHLLLTEKITALMWDSIDARYWCWHVEEGHIWPEGVSPLSRLSYTDS